MAGDGDYESLVADALLSNWKVEIWFWSSAWDKEDEGVTNDNVINYARTLIGNCICMIASHAHGLLD
ncbi:3351_t:CDS:2 [Gigaspora rosea]|nr:3351_t:CDS:2 [Gigaspora rosea]